MDCRHTSVYGLEQEDMCFCCESTNVTSCVMVDDRPVDVQKCDGCEIRYRCFTK